MTEFMLGLSAPFAGLHRLIFDSRLRALAVIPLLIALIAGTIFTVLGIYGLTFAIGALANQLAVFWALDPGGFWMLVVTVLLWPPGLLVMGVGVYMAIRLIAAPFYSYLAEKTLVKLGTRQDRPFVLGEWFWISLRMLFVSLVKSLIFGLAGLILFFFSFIPGLNILATLGFVHMLAFDISDYGFEALEWPLSRRFRHVRQHLATYSGLACGLGLAMLIPGLNLVLLPASVVGASETLHRTLARDGR